MICSLLIKGNDLDGQALDNVGIDGWLTNILVDAKQVARLSAIILPEILIGFIGFFVAIVYGLWHSASLTAVILCISGLSLLISKVLSHQLAKEKGVELEANEDVQSVLLDLLKGLPIFRAFKSQVFAYDYVSDRMRKWRNTQFNKNKAAVRLSSFAMGSGFIMNSVWFAFAFYLIGISKLSLGELLGFAMLSQYLNWLFMMFPILYSEYIESIVSLRRFLDFEQIFLRTSRKSPESLQMTEMIRIDHLTFAPQGNVILDDISLSIEKGEKYLLRGQSGAGKSTLAKILSGIYDNYEGKIYQSQGAEVSITYIPQSPSIFSDSIRENIVLGRKISNQELGEIIEQVGLSSLINSLENGWNTMIDAGIQQKFSQGEIQRIAIARALVEKSDFIIADEPVSAVDGEIEEKILKVLSEIESAVLLISHRQPKGYYFKQLELEKGKCIKDKKRASILGLALICRQFVR